MYYEYLHYSGRGRERPANHPPPPEYLFTQDSCKETSPPLLHTTTHNNTQKHTTTHNNTTQQHSVTLNYQCTCCFYGAVHNDFEGATSLLGALEGVGPENLDFFGPKWHERGPKKSRFSEPTPSNAPRNDVAPLKIIMYRAIKTTGTLIVITVYWLLSLRIK